MNDFSRHVTSILLGISVFWGGGTMGSAAESGKKTITSEQASFKVERVAGGLFHPWGMAFLPDGSILITERVGRLRIFKNGQLSSPLEGVPDAFVDQQGGLLDVALHPQFADNALIYLSYAAHDRTDKDLPGIHVARARLGDSGFNDYQVILLSNTKVWNGSNFGSRLVFDRDGHLYITVGDRGFQDDAQDLGSHGGKVLRLNDDGGIPDSNPFVGRSDAAAEIFSYGHRNPQGMTLHPETGRVWTHEHGPQGGDEVNVIDAGVNYGWPVITHGENYDGHPINDGLREKEGMAQPVHYWAPSIAPSGMAFYQGDAFPEWQGDLFVGALKAKVLVRLEMEGEKVVGEERISLVPGRGRIRDVAVDEKGFVYILIDSPNAGLFRLVPAK